MATFTLSADNAIRGDQLAAEISAACSLSLTVDQVRCTSPTTVAINDELLGEVSEAEVQAVVDAHVPAVAVPARVRTWALRAVMRLQGLAAPAETAMASLPDPQKTIAITHWEGGVDTERSNPLLVYLATALGLSTAQVDAIFAQASALQAEAPNPTP